MKQLIDFCIRERLLVVLFCFGIVAYGIYAAKNVPVDAIPNVGENQVIVLTDWMGRSPEGYRRPDYLPAFDCATGSSRRQECSRQKHVWF